MPTIYWHQRLIFLSKLFSYIVYNSYINKGIMYFCIQLKYQQCIFLGISSINVSHHGPTTLSFVFFILLPYLLFFFIHKYSYLKLTCVRIDATDRSEICIYFTPPYLIFCYIYHHYLDINALILCCK